LAIAVAIAVFGIISGLAFVSVIALPVEMPVQSNLELYLKKVKGSPILNAMGVGGMESNSGFALRTNNLRPSCLFCDGFN